MKSKKIVKIIGLILAGLVAVSSAFAEKRYVIPEKYLDFKEIILTTKPSVMKAAAVGFAF